ncbi:MAG: peptide-methionine (S)-S-oxide reductase, partial [Rhizobiales bacterium]|nr:peptide-methionine (S)-S-oxide reductase [Hyphomicrobiales bacterium]
MRKFGSNLIAATLFAATFIGGSAFAETKTALFAGGCYWCIEKDFEHVEGVVDV